MSQWLGLGILVLFSVALSLFMRLESKHRPPPPEPLRHWARLDGVTPAGDAYVELRVVQLQSRGFRAARWVEQRRVRRVSDGAIVEVLPERPFRLSS
jgi:hypothetical protein